MVEAKKDIVVTAVGHDPSGSWAKHLLNVSGFLDEIYNQRLISFTSSTNPITLDTAKNLGWDVVVEEASINRARVRAIERGIELGGQFINYWDGDRLLHAATVAPHEIGDLTQTIPNYDFFILGATLEAIKTHPSSEAVWEGVKSWRLGRYLGIEGDIANRGCFGFSREFATFLLTYQLEDSDETDGLFPLLALAYGKSYGGRGIGYKEYSGIASYEHWLFKGLSSEKSAEQETSVEDFIKRGRHVAGILQTAEKIAAMHELPSER